jgi:hypothetical protein
MNSKPIEQAKTRDLALALPALRRARKRAEEIAIATNTALVQMVDGKIVLVRPGNRGADGKGKG